MPNVDGTLTEEEKRAAAGLPAPAPIIPVQGNEITPFARTAAQVDADAARMEAAGKGLLDDEQRKYLVNTVLGGIGGGTSPEQKAEAARLESTKPKWYDTSQSPVHTKPALGALSVGLQGLAKAAQRNADLSADMPGRWLSMKQRDQGPANLLGIGSGIADYFINRKEREQKSDLDTALKQAQMYRTLNPAKKAGGAGDAQTALGLLNASTNFGNLNVRVPQAESTMRRGEAEVARKAAEDDPASTISKATADALIKAGADPQEVNGLSRRALLASNAFRNIQQSGRVHQYNAEYEKSMSAAQHAQEQVDAQQQKITEDENKRREALAAAAREEGDFQEGIEPTTKERENVGNLIGIRKKTLAAVQQLHKISQRFAEKYGGGVVGRAIQYVKTKGFNADAEDTKLLQDARNIKVDLGASIRGATGMGAPQEFENRITEGLVNAENSVGGILNPDEFYQGFLDSTNRSTNEGLRSNRFYLKGTKPLQPVERPKPEIYTPVPTDYTNGRQAPFSTEAGRPAPGPIVIPQNPLTQTTERLPDQPAQAGSPAKVADVVRAPAATAGGKQKYKVDYHDGQPPAMLELTDEQVKEYTDAGATVTK